jgi:hypothetical protein
MRARGRASATPRYFETMAHGFGWFDAVILADRRQEEEELRPTVTSHGS